MPNLNDDFESFRLSDDAKEPAFQVKPNWREELKRNAEINGDMAADANPETDLVNSYYDASVQEEDEDYEIQEDGSPRASW